MYLAPVDFLLRRFNLRESCRLDAGDAGNQIDLVNRAEGVSGGQGARLSRVQGGCSSRRV